MTHLGKSSPSAHDGTALGDGLKSSLPDDGSKSVLAGTETVAGSETPLNGGILSHEGPSICGAELQACLTAEEEHLSFWRGLALFIVRCVPEYFGRGM